MIRTPDAIVLRVVNDGVRLRSPNSARRRPGSGLLGMAERTGGRLAARPLPRGRYEVIAEFDLGTSADPPAAA